MKLKEYFKKAEKEKWAIGQFNVSNLEALKAVFLAARGLNSPAIIGASEGESNFIGLREIAVLVKMLRETPFPIFLNLDHGKTFDYIRKAVDAGYDAVHFDGSKLNLEENIKETKRIKKYAGGKGVLLEGEVGLIKGTSQIMEEAPQLKIQDLTSPDEASRFFQETKVDSLAVNVGTFHGMDKSGRNPHIVLERLAEIKEKTGKLPLVLHGGSGVPKEDIGAAINQGIVKININTELRVAFTGALKESLEKNPAETTPYKYLPSAIEAVKKVVEEKIKLFGSANKA